MMVRVESQPPKLLRLDTQKLATPHTEPKKKIIIYNDPEVDKIWYGFNAATEKNEK